jgi:hypothetical protein
MKKTIPFILLFIMFSSALSAQTVKLKHDPIGKWTFDAPYAPYGYNTGTSDIGFNDTTYTVSMTFTEMGYSFTGDNVKARNDSLFFDMWIEGTPINISLAIEDDTLIKGVADYFEGAVPFTMKKAVKKEEQ